MKTSFRKSENRFLGVPAVSAPFRIAAFLILLALFPDPVSGRQYKTHWTSPSHSRRGVTLEESGVSIRTNNGPPEKPANATGRKSVRPVQKPDTLSVAWSFARVGKNVRSDAPRASVHFTAPRSESFTAENISILLFNGENASGWALFVGPGEPGQQFVAALRAMREKLAAWREIAQANGVTYLVKEIPGLEVAGVEYGFGPRIPKKLSAECAFRKNQSTGKVEYLVRFLLKPVDGASTSPAPAAIRFLEMDLSGLDELIGTFPLVVPALREEEARRGKEDQAKAAVDGLFQ